MYRVLSLDGGGVRGLVTAIVLADLEARTGRPVADLFDLVAPTSTGAIVGLGLLRPGARDRPARKAQELADFYETTSTEVFRRSPWSRLWTAEGYLAPKYSAAELERRLRGELAETTMCEALCDVLVPAYDLRRREPYFFKSWQMRAGKQQNQAMWRVARATSAAPTYFPSAEVGDRDRTMALVDGGLVANNPAMCAYTETRRRMREGSIETDEIAVVSIGCGAMGFDYATPRTMVAGKLGWAKPLFDVVLDGQEDVVDYQMRNLLPEGCYFRLQADLPERIAGERTSVDDIDDATRANLAVLHRSALDLVRDCEDSLARIAEVLAPRGVSA